MLHESDLQMLYMDLLKRCDFDRALVDREFPLIPWDVKCRMVAEIKEQKGW